MRMPSIVGGGAEPGNRARTAEVGMKERDSVEGHPSDQTEHERGDDHLTCCQCAPSRDCVTADIECAFRICLTNVP